MKTITKDTIINKLCKTSDKAAKYGVIGYTIYCFVEAWRIKNGKASEEEIQKSTKFVGVGLLGIGALEICSTIADYGNRVVNNFNAKRVERAANEATEEIEDDVEDLDATLPDDDIDDIKDILEEEKEKQEEEKADEKKAEEEK